MQQWGMLKLEKNSNERGFPTREADNGGGGPKFGEGPRPQFTEPADQAHRQKGQLTGVLLRGEVVKCVEKGGGALGGFSSRSGKKGRRNGEGEGGGPGSTSAWGQEKKREGGAAVDSAGGAALSEQGSARGL
jgi:hypothetical protein